MFGKGGGGKGGHAKGRGGGKHAARGRGGRPGKPSDTATGKKGPNKPRDGGQAANPQADL